MRFNRHPRPSAFGDNPRKRAAVVRRQRLERERLPLFGDLIAETQLSVDEEMARRADGWTRWQQDQRDDRARRWREARARIASLGGNLAPIVRELWRTCRYPADPHYLLDLLDGIEIGRVDPERPPWRMTPEEIAVGRMKFAAFIAKGRAAA